MNTFRTLLFHGFLFTMIACDTGPKTIPGSDAPSNDQGSGTGVFSDPSGQPQANAVDPAIEKDLHTVVALEALPTEKYVYVRVKEGEDEFWIAATLQDINIGRSYFYRGGLLKTNFESKEYKRTFDELYLISQLIPSDHGTTMDPSGAPSVAAAPTNSTPLPALDVPGTTKIADLIATPKKYEGKVIQVNGTCTKVNPNIMGRNWIHMKDAGNEVVMTTDAPVTEGQNVTMIGTVALNKDFGSGYQYDILLEGGRWVK
ncbi:MAG: hypothetical protein WAR83_10765 [Flavobacteriales bacterium]|nr:hypothetical protein [Flavobacteriales bacterium]